MSPWRRPRAWAPALVAALCLAAVGMAQLGPSEAREDVEQPPSSIGEEARALLGGLQVGDRIMGWDVQALDGPRNGVLRVHVGRDDVRFALMVATKGQLSQAPPVETERYAIFYGHAHPPNTRLPGGTIRATTHALARRVRANEATVEVPGM